MSNVLSISEFLDLSESLPVIDVRSPAEFEHGHIPGAHSIPLLSNDERAEVGTLYVQKGREFAVDRGLELFGPRMVDTLHQGMAIARDKQLLVHCWRGGMRSGTMAWLFSLNGLKVYTLEGGYKAYRRAVLESFEQPAQVITLGGLTGCGKTEILLELEQMGEQVIDLEGLANHKGSAFGALGQPPQPTNMQFENDLYRQWRKHDLSRPIWLEDESKRIGAAQMPDSLYEQKQAAPVMEVRMPESERLRWLAENYAQFDPVLLKEAIARIQKRLGSQRTQEALDAIDSGDVRWIEIVLGYYDHYYSRSLEKRTERVHPVECDKNDPKANAIKVKQMAYQVLDL